MIAFDEDAAMEILKKCGADGLAVYVAMETIEAREDLPVDVIAGMCGFTKERTLSACQRVGLYLLGVKVEDVGEQSRLHLHGVS
ncbi:hypothetical protein [Alicyclobacillus ferrooxydans]|uniref:Uncharacterized protein n=1 Tax=Alicyclobacillus ferrooxydans TaxID=471514 RepID=A0A0P9EUQ0_9BACL|nr:hypothetical protein [Alicyclobacillus ferrooxydans]KPV42696.1 hypothetical protein AN477_16335 [Alicyclobacillus ferrooxydans]